MDASKTTTAAIPSMPLGEDYPEIRAAIRKICEGFPGAYWREKEEKEAYPSEFVAARLRGVTVKVIDRLNGEVARHSIPVYAS